MTFVTSINKSVSNGHIGVVFEAFDEFEPLRWFKKIKFVPDDAGVCGVQVRLTLGPTLQNFFAAIC